MEVSDNTEQEAWLLWGDREGQAVGWHIIDDTLEGYVSDASESSTAPLETGFETGTKWNLTAFYNQPTDVHFYVRPPPEDPHTPEEFTQPVRDGINKILWPDALASIDEAIPEGSEDSKNALSLDLTNTNGSSKRLFWSNWRNYQYPLYGKWNPFRTR